MNFPANVSLKHQTQLRYVTFITRLLRYDVFKLFGIIAEIQKDLENEEM